MLDYHIVTTIMILMLRNDVSVDNMVVEIEPNDLFPRKAGGVKPEYPWKVGRVGF